METKQTLMTLIDVAEGRAPADLLIKNAKIVDVFNGSIFEGNVAVAGTKIVGFTDADAPAREVFDAEGSYLVPGLINGHVHIESSHCSPKEYARLVVPCGTTTAVADPHEICNVCGLTGLDYMIEASEDVGMEIFFMLPSCVPSTDFEHAGAVLNAEELAKRIDHPRVLGLGEVMNVPAICRGVEPALEKLLVCKNAGKHMDGHSPAISLRDLDAYCAAGVMTDHESESPEELREKIRRGTWVMLRQGSSCKNLAALSKGLNRYNMSRVLLCTDDKHPKSILEEGDLDNNVRMLIAEGIDPIDAIRMGTINAAVCHRLFDRGAIAPGYQADMLLVRDLQEFRPWMVFSKGHRAARDGRLLYVAKEHSPEAVSARMFVRPLSKESFEIPLSSDQIRAIGIIPGGIVTDEVFMTVRRDEAGHMLCDKEKDLCKLAVIERHHATEHMAVVPIHNYGLKGGAVATTIAHDSHNLLIAGDNNADMLLAAETLIGVGGGLCVVKDGRVLGVMPHPIAGLMTELPGEEVAARLDEMHAIAKQELHVNPAIDPFMTLAFMALPVIPELKVTDAGLFKYSKFDFVPVEREEAK